MEMAKKLDYQPLTTPKSVRLLRLHHSAKEPHGLRISIRTVELSDKPFFYALSYTWGPAYRNLPNKNNANEAPDDRDNDVPTFDIIANEETTATTANSATEGDHGSKQSELSISSLGPEKFVSVRENLFDFMQFMSSCEDLNKHLFWIDAISINQAHTSERSRQVALMGEIFKAAEKVVAWLGKMNPPPDVDWLLDDFIPRLREIIHEEGVGFRMSKNIDCSDPELVDMLGEEDCATWRQTLIPTLKFLGQCSWFGRGWVVQEVLLKRSADVLLYAGSTMLSWRGLNTLADIFRRVGWADSLDSYTDWPSSDPEVDGPELILVINMLRSFASAKGSTKRSKREYVRFGFTTSEEFWYTCLLLNLQVITRKKFSENRDLVYGCLGMLDEVLPKGMTNPIIPDYNLSVEELFIQVGSMIVRNIPILHYMSTVQWVDGGRESDLPSWVRDWRMDQVSCQVLVCNKSRFAALGVKHGFGGWDFDASLTKESLGPPPTVNGRVLELCGAKFDKIETCYKLDLPGRSSVAHLLRFCLEPGEIYEATVEPYMQAVFRILVADCLSDSSLKDDLNAITRAWLVRYIHEEITHVGDEMLVAEVLQLLGTVRGNSLINKWLPTLHELYSVGNPDCSLSNSIKFKIDAFDTEFRLVTMRRWLYRTKQGYLGPGPDSIKPGDEIFVIKRSRVPFILRTTSERSESFLHVGETYLHGFMRGEMMIPDVVANLGPVRIV